jgi:hypothetical protein
VTMKNAVFWDVTPCGSCKGRRLNDTVFLDVAPCGSSGVLSQKTTFFFPTQFYEMFEAFPCFVPSFRWCQSWPIVQHEAEWSGWTKC